MSFEEIEEVVIPRLGISYRDMTLNEIVTAFNGLLKEKNKDYDYLRRIVFNSARLQAFFVVKSMGGKTPSIKSPEDLLTFDWENDNKLETPSDEQWEEMINRFPQTINDKPGS